RPLLRRCARVCRARFAVPRRPPRSTLFPYTTLFDLLLPSLLSAVNPEIKSEYLTDSRKRVSLRFVWLTKRNNSPSCNIRITTVRSEEHTSELQSRENLVCRLLLEKKNTS